MLEDYDMFGGLEIYCRKLRCVFLFTVPGRIFFWTGWIVVQVVTCCRSMVVMYVTVHTLLIDILY